MKLNRSLYTNALFACAISPIIAWLSAGNAHGQETDEPIRQTAQKTEAQHNKVVSAFEYKFPAIGTLVTFKAFSDDEKKVERAFTQARERVEALGNRFSDYVDNSEARLLPQQAADRFIEPSDEMKELLQNSARWHRQSLGTFDASLGTLTKLYRKYRRREVLPPQAKITAALQHCGWSKVELSPSGAIKILDRELQLDFGAIGKGFIVDKAFETLQSQGLDICMVDISGNIRCGAPPPGYPGWKVAVAPMKKGGKPLRQIEIANQAIATSGDLWQYVVVDGVRRSHIIDPRTGVGVVGPVSASVIAQSATDADAMATASCILTTKQALKIAEEQKLEVLIAHNSQGRLNVVCSEAFPEDQ